MANIALLSVIGDAVLAQQYNADIIYNRRPSAPANPSLIQSTFCPPVVKEKKWSSMWK